MIDPTINDLTSALGHGVVRRVTRELSDEHDSSTCECGEGGEPCAMCRWANEQEREQPRPQLWADATTVRAAVLDVIDSGCKHDDGMGHEWRLDSGLEEFANEQRVAFVDAVLARIAQLQQLHGYPRIEQLCEKHKRLRLSAYNGWCVECPREE